MTGRLGLPEALDPRRKPLVGMVHLLALPGAPAWAGSVDAVLDRAASDARALTEGGVDAVLVENFHDVPFHPGPVPPWTVAAMTRAVARVCEVAAGRPVGVNVLRNDARAALAVAAATGAAFVRVNVHTGSMWTDQGLLEGRAWETLRLRERLGARVAVLADVHVKHATPPPGSVLEDAARDAWSRGLADGLIVTGAGTGRGADPDALRRLRRALPDAPLWVGSGVTPDRAPELAPLSDGAIVGSWLHQDGELGRPLDAGRVLELVQIWRHSG